MSSLQLMVSSSVVELTELENHHLALIIMTTDACKSNQKILKLMDKFDEEQKIFIVSKYLFCINLNFTKRRKVYSREN